MSNRTVVDSQWRYAFQFSLPIQAVTPLSRDPNLLPLPVDNAVPADTSLADESAAERPPPPSNRLTTVNLDVQNLIMSLLPTRDLSVLTRTCRYFLDTGLLSLSARVPEQVLGHGARVASLHAFLRSHSGPLSRIHLITDLHFNLPYEPSYYWDVHGKTLRAQHIDAFLGILRSCRHLRRLRIDGWFKALPTSLLLHTLATSHTKLEELTLAIAGRHDVEEKDLRKLGRLSKVRSIAIQAASTTSLLALQPIASALVEVDLIRIREDVPAVPFANVKMLGVLTNRDPTWLQKVTTVFPNLSGLVLRPNNGTSLRHRCYTASGRAEDDSLRGRNSLQWRSVCANAWPSLDAVWVHEICSLYCIGLSREIHALSVPVERPQASNMFQVVLADTQPSFLELRFDLYRYSQGAGAQRDGLGLMDASAGSSLRCLALVLDFVHHDYRSQEKPLLEALARGLGDSSLTHVLIRYRVGSSHLTVHNAAEVIAHAPEYATLLAQASSTLGWVGVEISGWGLLSWNVSRALPGNMAAATAQEAPRPVELVELSEWMGRKVIEAENMDVFALVRP